jgi:hypothetical protein
VVPVAASPTAQSPITALIDQEYPGVTRRSREDTSIRDLYRQELKEYQAAIELNENNIEARNNMAGLGFAA